MSVRETNEDDKGARVSAQPKADSDPRVQILLATHNGEQFLQDQLDSLLAQSYLNWEICAHDDASSDETRYILDRFRKANPGRLRISTMAQKPWGAVRAFSALLEQASADYVMFCDQDDVWNPEKIAKLMQRMREVEAEHPGAPVIVHCDLEVVDESLRCIAPSFIRYSRLQPVPGTLREALVQNSVTGCAMLLNRRSVDLALPVHGDAVMHDMWAVCRVVKGGGVISFVAEPLVRYRQHGANRLGAKRVGWWHFLRRVPSAVQRFQTLIRQSRAIDPSISTVSLVQTKLRLSLCRLG